MNFKIRYSTNLCGYWRKNKARPQALFSLKAQARPPCVFRNTIDGLCNETFELWSLSNGIVEDLIDVGTFFRMDRKRKEATYERSRNGNNAKKLMTTRDVINEYFMFFSLRILSMTMNCFGDVFYFAEKQEKPMYWNKSNGFP